MSASNAPNLAGQYPEVVIKQLQDYKSGKRGSAIMETLARHLSDRDITALAAYYASLPKARTAPTTYDETLPPLVRVATRCATSHRASRATAASTRNSAHPGWRACHTITSLLNCVPSATDSAATTPKARCATWPGQ